MRILHICNYYSDKLKYQEFYLVKEHLDMGHEVFIITSERLFPFPNYDDTVKSLYGDRIFTSPGTLKQGNLTIIRLPVITEIGARVLLKGFSKSLIMINPDKIIVHGILQFHTISILKWIKKSKSRANIIFDEHMLYSDIQDSSIKKNLYLIFGYIYGKRIYGVADKIIAISYGSVRLINDLLKMNGDKIKLIPLGVDTSVFYPNQALRNSFREQIGVSPEEILITYTGKIDSHKFVHSIFEALNTITSTKKIVILCVGNVSKPYLSQFDQAVQNSKYRAIHLPSVPHSKLPCVYNATDIAVWPAHQTISTIEASACQTAVICADYLKERFKNNNGIGIKVGSLDSLSSALKKLVEDDVLRHSMSINGVELIQEEFDWKKIAIQFIS